MIKGQASSTAVRYIPESERNCPPGEPQTIFGIKLKKGHESNVVFSNYASTGKDGRKGYREVSAARLDSADVSHFLMVVEYVENYQFSSDFPDLAAQGCIKKITDEVVLSKVAADIDADLLLELFEASNNASTLRAGEKKDLPLLSTSPSGSP